MTFRVLDLFSGIGGFAIGLHKAGGFETTQFCEIDKHAQKVLRKNFPNVPIHDNIKTLTCQLNEYDVICGGFPCVDISIGGAQKGITAERSGLWKEYLRVINEVRPKYAIIENVGQLRKNGLGVVLRDLSRIGYDVEWTCISAQSVGYPHQRERLFIISYPSKQRLNECIREERPLYINEEWKSEETYSEGEECQSESIEVRPILSKGIFDSLRSTYPNEFTSVSSVCRVTDGVSEGSYESRRKQRIKQLGNAIVPRIAEIIGRAIMMKEKE